MIPEWCTYPDADRPVWGCDSLLFGLVTSKEYCKNCEMNKDYDKDTGHRKTTEREGEEYGSRKEKKRFDRLMSIPLENVSDKDIVWALNQVEFNSITSQKMWEKELERREENRKYLYTLRLTKRQAELLSYACDRFSRLICGQDWTFQELMEEAWEKRAKEATGNFMDKEFEGGWSEARQDAEMFSRQIKRRFWGLEQNAMYGIKYDDVADILFDIHQTIRHQLWLDRPEDKKSHITVDADEPMKIGSEPLAKITRND